MIDGPTVASRLDGLAAQGGGFLDPATQVTLAAQPNSDADFNAQVQAMRAAAQQQPQSVPSVTYDASVAPPQQSQQQKLVEFVHNTYGAPQVSPDSLTGIQTALAANGYGKDLPVNGVWNPDWQAAITQAHNDHVSAQMQGEKQLATIRTKSLIADLNHQLTITGGLDSLVGFAGSLAHDARQAVGDASGLISFGGKYVANELTGAISGRDYSGGGQEGIFNEAAQKFYGTTSELQGQTTQQAQSQFENAQGNVSGGVVAGHVLGDVATALMVLPATDLAAGALKAGAKGVGAVVTGSTKDMVAKAFTRMPGNAVRSPGFLARTLVGEKGAVTAEGEPVLGALTRNTVVNGQAAENLPWIAQIGPALYKAQDGWYAARSRLAFPYQFPIVQAAGKLGQRIIIGGGAVQAAAAGQTALQGPNEFSQDVSGNYVSPLDARVNVLGLSLGINTLGYLAHGPMPTAQAAQVAGGSAQAASRTVRALSNAATTITGGPLDPLPAFQLASKSYNRLRTVPSLNDLAANFGGDMAMFRDFLQNGKYPQHAVALAVQDRYNKAFLDGEAVPDNLMDGPGKKWVQDATHEIQTDPLLRSQALTAAAGNADKLTASFVTEMQQVGSQLHRLAGGGPDAQALVQSWHDLRRITSNPDHLGQLITPESWQIAQQQHDLHEFADASSVGIGGKGGTPSPVNPRSPDAAWLMANNTAHVKGSVGIANKDRWTVATVTAKRQAIAADWQHFQTRIDAAKDPVEQLQIHNEMNDYAMRQLAVIGTHADRNVQQLQELYRNVDGNIAGGVAQGEALDALLQDVGSTMASDIYLPHDASPELKAIAARMDERGHKLVYGKGVGYAGENPNINYDLIGQEMNLRQRAFASLGLSMGKAADASLAAIRVANFKHRLQEQMDSGVVGQRSDLHTPDLITWMLSHDSSGARSPVLDTGNMENAIRGVTQNRLAKEVTAVRSLSDSTPMSDTELQAAINEAHERMISALGIGGLTRKSFISKLTDPNRLPWLAKQDALGQYSDLNAAQRQAQAFTKEEAGHIHDAWLASAADIPGYFTGLGHLPALAQAGFGALGSKWAQSDPNPVQSALLGITRLPAAYTRAITRIRYQMSPMFDARRVVKTSMKIAADGGRTTVSPLNSLIAEAGTLGAKRVLDTLDKVMPGYFNSDEAQWLDANSRFLVQNSMFGFYNPRFYAAWALHDMQVRGVPADQWSERLGKIFSYGERTGVERSMTTTFFPFSFDKTLYRAVGGYMLDRPAQSLLMLKGFQAYDSWAQQHQDNPLSYAWYQKNLPILSELARLNAFDHGIGPGMVGGINAPVIHAVLNAFLPQSLASTSQSNKVLKAMIPVWNDLSRITTEVTQSGTAMWRISQQALYNAGQLMGSPDLGLNAPPSSTQGKYALTDALQYRRQLTDAMAKVLAYNASSPSSPVLWPNNDSVPGGKNAARGLPVSASTINAIVKARYPSFDTSKGVAIAEQRRIDLNNFLSANVNDPQLAGVRGFATDVNSLATHVRLGDLPDAQLRDYAQSLRDYALPLAAGNPDFAKLYDTTFAHVLGPRK